MEPYRSRSATPSRSAKTVGESDVYLFAGITGDFSPNHVNKEAMGKTPYKERIAHGVLSVGFASTTSTLMIEKAGATAVSVGYDRDPLRQAHLYRRYGHRDLHHLRGRRREPQDARRYRGHQPARRGVHRGQAHPEVPHLARPAGGTP